MNTIITYKFGNYFPIRIVIVGYLAILFSFYIWNLTESPTLGIIMLILPCFVCFTFKGIEIDPNLKKYKDYYRYFGLKTGKWKSLENYPYISLLSHTVSYNLSNLGAQNAKIKEQVYEIYLLNQTHRHKILLKSGKDLEKMTSALKEMSEEINLEIVKYSPVLSEKTLARRSRR